MLPDVAIFGITKLLEKMTLQKNSVMKSVIKFFDKNNLLVRAELEVKTETKERRSYIDLQPMNEVKVFSMSRSYNGSSGQCLDDILNEPDPEMSTDGTKNINS